MTDFVVHTIENAPEGSVGALQELKSSVGFLPNLAAGMAGSPQLLRGFGAVRDLYQAGTFTQPEIQALSLVAAVENDCGWCVAFHTAMGLRVGLPKDAVEALRSGKEPNDPKLAVLCAYAREMVQQRGAVSEGTLGRFLAVGYSRAQALEVVLGMAFSLMANYAGHLVDPPLDPPFQAHAWRKG